MKESAGLVNKLIDKCSGFLFNLIIFVLTVGFLFIIHESVSIEFICTGDGCKISRDHRETCDKFNNEFCQQLNNKDVNYEQDGRSKTEQKE